eukprot:PITA_02908
MEKSRILIVGATGYIGRHIAKASLDFGHPTFLLVRDSASTVASKPEKVQLLESFEASGANILHGSLEDFWSVVEAIKKVDVVISTIGGGASQTQLSDSCMDSFSLQHNIINAIKQVGTIKRFLPAEFGNDVDRVNAVEPAKSSYFAVKAELRRAIEGQGIPYTYICCNCFAGLFVSNLGQRGLRVPPTDKIEILGNGNAKAVFMTEEDVGIFTIKAMDDERTVNKTLHFRPPPNTLSFNDLVALWEKKIGKTLRKIFIEEDQLLKQIAEAPFPAALLLSLRYSFFVKGEQTNFKIGDEGVEVSELYPHMKYTTMEEYLDKYV